MSVHVDTIVEQQEEIALLKQEVATLKEQLDKGRAATERLIVASQRALSLLDEMKRTFTARQIRQAIEAATTALRP